MTLSGSTSILARPRALGSAQAVRAQQTAVCLRRAAATTNSLTRDHYLSKAVLVNLPVADRVAFRYSGRGVPTQDLVQVARIGLIKAVRGFDTGAGFNFLAYAIPTISGELKRHFRDNGWTVRPPRRIQDLQPRIAHATATLTQEIGRTPTSGNVADFLGIDEASVIEARAAEGCFTPASLDLTYPGDTGGPTWAEALGEDDPEFARLEAKLILGPVFDRLSERDRMVLRLRFVDALTQAEIGRRVGVTQMQVSRILARILRLVREELVA